MIDENHTQLAVDFVMGELNGSQCTNLDRELARNPELQKLVSELEQVAAELTFAFSNPQKGLCKAPEGLFEKILARIDQDGNKTALHSLSPNAAESYDTAPGLVVTDREGFIQWVNEDFTQLCGYHLSEIVGKKPGSFLRGPLTDPACTNAMREAALRGEPCTQELVNYHKNGEPYWVTISITPVLDEQKNATHFTAIERKIQGRKIPDLVPA